MRKHLFAIALTVPFLIPFQNCSKVGFDAVEQDSSNSKKNGEPTLPSPKDTTDNFRTNENTPLANKTSSASDLTDQVSVFDNLSSPTYGTVTIVDAATGKFSYTPNHNYFGIDQFQLTEVNPGLGRTVVRKVVIQVDRVDQPYIVSDVFHFDFNTSNNPFTIVVADLAGRNPFAALSATGAITSLTSTHGTIVKTATGFAYTPNPGFRGTDVVKLYARDSLGGLSSKDVRFITGNPFRTIQPGMAVRGSNCVMCHAQISSNFVTDFGFGDSYFFGKQNGPLKDQIYSLRLHSNQAANQYHPEWITTAAFANGAKLIVPKQSLGFKYADLAVPSWVDKTVAWMNSTTIADLLTKIQLVAGSTFQATVVAKDFIYIGAPSVSEIRTAGQLDSGHPVQYFKDNADTSYDFSGLEFQSAGYYKNNGELVCDGDLFVEGNVFLNDVKLKTISGCRLHATGVVFMQKALTFVGGANSNKNLQVVSARAISIGIGLTHCESTTNPGWYFSSSVVNPIQKRFVSIVSGNGVVTRNTNPNTSTVFERTSNTPADEGAYILAQAQKIQGLQDASCHGRSLTFERLMLVAPQIHSRYKGNFSGVVIGEFPLFSLENFVYQFDPVFQNVSVFPLLNMDKILKVQ